MTEEGAHPRLGLALSGGGHRAAFFHIGVLARLAELGLLRPIQVISTVAGGSIVGALYYLHVKNLLESKAKKQRSVGGTIFSVILHTGIIAGAIYATAHATIA